MNDIFGKRRLTGIAAFGLAIVGSVGVSGVARAQVFVSDFFGSTGISEYSFSGTFERTFVAFGSGGLSQPSGMTFGADGNLYVSSYGSNAIKKYDGTTGAYLGNVVTGGNAPIDVAFGTDGSIYTPTYNSNTVLKVNPTTGAIVQTYSVPGRPDGVAVRPNGNVIVASANGADPVEINPTTGATTTFATGIGVNVGVTAGPDGRFYFTDYSGGTVRVASATGGATSVFTTGGSLSHPQYMGFGNGSLYVGSISNNTVQYFNATTGAYQGSFTSNSATGIAIRGIGSAASPEPGSVALAALALPGLLGGIVARRRRGNA